ncbi:YcgL domain-containing protein [Shewanella sp. WXL01]|uniref:YcgL domain-containing protein EXU30_18925 n=1 Tax=Shewanella maritima TaxID=2520507 RepID=A0A411PLU7_9GAMM|nr:MULTISPECIES: YcgL domain-containing protein [Shewanella]NKF51570.1 YcgL domain-containing protein [Shewanella sp. WXL01]QBF84506.1 YcgL domain-containing protein [Shewanella maritima]
MICAVYKSSRKPDTYLYVEKRDQFDAVPQPLMDMFGAPTFVMLLPIEKTKKLALADIDKVKSELKDKGFYLQLPPPSENLLEQHRLDLGLSEKVDPDTVFARNAEDK